MSNKPLTDDLRIIDTEEALAPAQLILEHPISLISEQTVLQARKATKDILHDKDDRLVVICGPCSIHDLEAAKEYANKLKVFIQKHEKQLHIIMRVYFEKPRTTIGWKGLINDPDLNGSFQINKGLKTARKLLLDLNNMGVSCATEYLDLISPQYYSDLISWGAIGARTTESQSHRELASGLSCPVGFKNGTNGNLQIAVDAIQSSSKPHYFLSVTKQGKSAIFGTSGNDDCHVILRGGTKPNYDAASVDAACELLDSSSLRPMVMIDLSHANSQKNHDNQSLVADNIAQQIEQGEQRIIGVMIESHLVEGNQSISSEKPLVYGKSITDACINIDQTEQVLQRLATAVDARRAKLAG